MEVWKNLDRLPGYAISNYGRVKSFKNKKEKLLKVVENNRGYELVCLSHNNIKYTSYIHRLVAEVFIPTARNIHELEVNHKDKNPKNNHVNNLEWTSYVENAFHKIDPNRYFLIKRFQDAADKLSNEQLECFISSLENSIK